MADLTETLAAMRQHEKYCDRGHGAYSALLSAVENVLALCDEVAAEPYGHSEERARQSLRKNLALRYRKALTDALGGE